MIMINGKINPFFIVSSGRSGTTLLSALLNASDQVHIPPESDFIARAYPFFYSRNTFTEEDYRKVAKFFLLTSQRNWNFDTKALSDILNENKPQSFDEINNVIYNAFLNKNKLNKAQWGIKSPVLIASIGRIRKVFPNAKLIHVVRDGRDVYLSYKSVHKTDKPFGPKSILTCALYWIDGLRRIESFLGNIICEVKYENLLIDFENSLQLICDFIGINHKDKEKFQNYYQSNKLSFLILAEHSKSIHKKVNKGIDPTNINKYKSRMDKYHIFIFELLTAPYLKKYGYELEFKFLAFSLFNILRLPLYFAARLFNNVRYAKRERSLFNRVLDTLQENL